MIEITETKEKLIHLPGKWLIIGPNSLVGSAFIDQTAKVSELHGAGRSAPISADLKSFQSLDITNREQVLWAIEAFEGQYLINFSADTDVNGAETNKERTHDTNVLGTRYIIEGCKSFGKVPVFLSTGFEYKEGNPPYSEDDPLESDPAKIGQYTWTKILAEQEIVKSGIEAIILSISYPYRKVFAQKSDFARNSLKVYDDFKSGARPSIYPMFTDQTLTPTYINDLAPALVLLIEQGARGKFNIVSPELITPYEFVCELLRVARGVEHPEDIIPKGTLAQFQIDNPNSAKRPIHGGESTEKITKFGFTPTTWQDGIKVYYSP